MRSSELVSTGHLARKAVIYVRQSTAHQVLTNQESLKLQYALKKRATDLGWHAEDVEVVDADLGLTGSAVDHREGFKDLLARVTLGQVGLVLSSEVTRLSRNCSDWYPLLDICGYKGCLIADADGVYDPATVNGRLILGLKGTLSEMELHTIRSRMNAALLNKAERGELAQKLPTGLERDQHGLVHKDPNIEVQDRISLVFETFLRLRSASKVLRFFSASELLLPRRDRFGDIVPEGKRDDTSCCCAHCTKGQYANASLGIMLACHSNAISQRFLRAPTRGNYRYLHVGGAKAGGGG